MEISDNDDGLKLKGGIKKKILAKNEKRTSQELKKNMDSLSQNKKRSLEENEIVRVAEEIKAKRLKKNDKMKLYRQKRKAAATPEEVEALRLYHLEGARKYRQNKREKEDSMLEKAMELLSQNHELSLEENDVVRKAEEIKASRLQRKQNFHNRKAATSPEEEEAKRLKNMEKSRRFYQNRKATATPEEKEARRLNNLECARRHRQKRSAAATPEEVEALRLQYLEKARIYGQNKRKMEDSILEKAMEVLGQNQELSLEENEIVRRAEEVKAKRLERSESAKQYRQKQKAAAPSEKVEAMRLKRFKRNQKYKQQNREKEGSILKKAMELLSQNHKMSLEENEIVRTAEEIKAKRLKRCENLKQYHRKRKDTATPEEIETMRLKKLEQGRRLHQKRKAKATHAEKETIRLKRLENSRQYRIAREEKEESIPRQATELLRQNQGMASDEREVLRLAEKIKVERLKRNGKQFKILNSSERLRTDQVISNVPSVIDEIKIEEEVLQESTIKTIPLRQNVNPILDKQLISSCSWLELSEGFMTGGNSLSNTTFPSSGISESFANCYGLSTKIDRKKLRLEEPFRCMRVLINATAKRDVLAVFGKQIAQKLRTSKKDEAEVGIAKQLIDNVLRNLAIGAYNSKTKIVLML